jgi:hypothetical protein
MMLEALWLMVLTPAYQSAYQRDNRRDTYQRACAVPGILNHQVPVAS